MPYGTSSSIPTSSTASPKRSTTMRTSASISGSHRGSRLTRRPNQMKTIMAGYTKNLECHCWGCRGSLLGGYGPVPYSVLTPLRILALCLLSDVSRRVWDRQERSCVEGSLTCLDSVVTKRPAVPGPTGTADAHTVIHSDQSGQFTSWAFTRRSIDSGLLPSMGSIGDCFDNAMIESFWSRMQVELLDRQRWKTRIELANAIFEYLEIFHNRQRRHSALGMLTPIEFETRYQPTTAA